MGSNDSTIVSIGGAPTMMPTADGDVDLEGRQVQATVRARLFGKKDEPVKIGRFAVLRRLGAGGMGVVYAAYDEELDRRVAIKLLRADVGGEGQHRLLREAQAMARLSHPNVVTVHEVGTFEGQVFVAMEFVRGRTLRVWLAEEQRAWVEVVEVLRQAAAGLIAAHAQGLVHRDFKPDNVLIGDDGRVRVVDFGLARAQGPRETVNPEEIESTLRENRPPSLEQPITQAGTIMGTPAYMAPEQFIGAGVDERADQFSFCVTLYESIYGVRPFVGKTVHTLMRRIMTGELQEPPAGVRAPSWLQQLILRGLKVHPDDRFPSMTEVVRELAHDHGRRSRRMLGATGVLAVGAGLAALYGAGDDDVPCSRVGDRVTEVWNETHRAAALTAFEATELPYAHHAWSATEAVIDDFAARWVAARKDACEATWVREEQSEELLDRRMHCLDRRIYELRAFVNILTSADRTVVDNAPDAAARLPGLRVCSDTEALMGWMKLPEDEDVAEKAEQFRRLLSDARVLLAAGRYRRARVHLEGIADSVSELGYRPLEAETLLALADLQERTGDAATAEGTLERAVLAAEAGRHTPAVVEISVELMYVVGSRLGRHDDALRWGRRAQAALEALGDGDRRAASLHNAFGAVFQAQGKYEQAAESFSAAREIFAAIEDPQVVNTLNNLGSALNHLGRAEEAEEQFTRALALATGSLGQDHPDVATVLHGLGNAQLLRGALDDALERYQRSLAIRVDSLGPDHPELATTLGMISNVYYVQGRYALALDYVVRAQAIFERAFGREHATTAAMLSNVAVLAGALGDNEKSLRYEQEALTIRRRVLGPDHDEVGLSLSNIAAALDELGRRDEALARYREALAIRRKALGAEHPGLVATLVGMANIESRMGRHAHALEHVEQAVAVAESGDKRTLAKSRFTLARVLDAAGRDRQRALEQAEAALTLYGADADDAGRRKEIGDWIAVREP